MFLEAVFLLNFLWKLQKLSFPHLACNYIVITPYCQDFYFYKDLYCKYRNLQFYSGVLLRFSADNDNWQNPRTLYLQVKYFFVKVVSRFLTLRGRAVSGLRPGLGSGLLAAPPAFARCCGVRLRRPPHPFLEEVCGKGITGVLFPAVR